MREVFLEEFGVVYINKARLREWSVAVRARDGKCMDCGCAEDLHAHHVLSKAARPDLALDMGNGRTLCYRCHKAEHERNKQTRRTTTKVRPQRRTQEREMQAQIDVLTAEVESLRRELAGIAAGPGVPVGDGLLRQKVGECQRGACKSGISLAALEAFYRRNAA